MEGVKKAAEKAGAGKSPQKPAAVGLVPFRGTKVHQAAGGMAKPVVVAGGNPVALLPILCKNCKMGFKTAGEAALHFTKIPHNLNFKQSHKMIAKLTLNNKGKIPSVESLLLSILENVPNVEIICFAKRDYDCTAVLRPLRQGKKDEKVTLERFQELFGGWGKKVRMEKGFYHLRACPSLAIKMAKDQAEVDKKKKPGPDPLEVDRVLSLYTNGISSQMKVLPGLILMDDISEERDRKSLCERLRKLLSSGFGCSPEEGAIKVSMFGSSVNGFGFSGCDVDILVQIPDRCVGGREAIREKAEEDVERKLQQKKAHKTEAILKRYQNEYRALQSIKAARVPIVKFFDATTRLQCDLSFKNPMSLLNSHFIRQVFEKEERFREFGITVRYWAHRHQLAGHSSNLNGLSFSNYALIMMIVFYLQTQKLLPSVEKMQEDLADDICHEIEGWECGFDVGKGSNRYMAIKASVATLSDLLTGFFTFYSHFDYASSVISPYAGKPLPRSQFKDIAVSLEMAGKGKTGKAAKDFGSEPGFAKYWRVVSAATAASVDSGRKDNDQKDNSPTPDDKVGGAAEVKEESEEDKKTEDGVKIGCEIDNGNEDKSSAPDDKVGSAAEVKEESEEDKKTKDGEEDNDNEDKESKVIVEDQANVDKNEGKDNVDKNEDKDNVDKDKVGKEDKDKVGNKSKVNMDKEDKVNVGKEDGENLGNKSNVNVVIKDKSGKEDKGKSGGKSGKPTRRLLPVSQEVCIQDPFELNHNVSKGIDEVGIANWINHCQHTVKLLQEGITNLSDIFQFGLDIPTKPQSRKQTKKEEKSRKYKEEQAKKMAVAEKSGAIQKDEKTAAGQNETQSKATSVKTIGKDVSEKVSDKMSDKTDDSFKVVRATTAVTTNEQSDSSDEESDSNSDSNDDTNDDDDDDESESDEEDSDKSDGETVTSQSEVTSHDDDSNLIDVIQEKLAKLPKLTPIVSVVNTAADDKSVTNPKTAVVPETSDLKSGAVAESADQSAVPKITATVHPESSDAVPTGSVSTAAVTTSAQPGENQAGIDLKDNQKCFFIEMNSKIASKILRQSGPVSEGEFLRFVSGLVKVILKKVLLMQVVSSEVKQGLESQRQLEEGLAFREEGGGTSSDLLSDLLDLSTASAASFEEEEEDDSVCEIACTSKYPVWERRKSVRKEHSLNAQNMEVETAITYLALSASFEAKTWSREQPKPILKFNLSMRSSENKDSAHLMRVCCRFAENEGYEKPAKAGFEFLQAFLPKMVNMQTQCWLNQIQEAVKSSD